MARIPLQVAGRGLETGSPVSYSGASPVGEALQGLGSALGGMADQQRMLAERARQQQEDVENFDTTQKFQQFKIAAYGDREEIAKNTPVSGLGLHDMSVASLQKRRDEFLATVPERLKPKMQSLLDTEQAQFSADSAKLEYEQRSSWYRDGLTKAVGTGQEQVFNNPAAIEAARQEALRSVDASGLPEAEKEEWRQKVKEGLSASFAARQLQDNPAALAGSLGVALPSAVGYGDRSLPAGMRNNNPGNIKFVGRTRFKGVVGPSENTDQGDPQSVFETPEAGMRAAYELAKRKYDGGKVTANELIAGNGGWTPGNTQAAENIARSMGIDPNEDLNLNDKAGAARFLRALVQQEHGSASQAYSDEMIAAAVDGTPGPDAPTAPAGRSLPLIGQGGGAADLTGVRPIIVDRFQALQNQWGRALPINSGHRDPARNARVGGAKGSQHIDGNALDVDVSSLSNEERTQLIGMASAMGFTGIGVYNNAVHLDMGARRSWGPNYRAESVPGWAKGAIDAHLAGRGDAAVGGGLTAPGIKLDPNLADLPFAERLKLAGQAQQAVASLQKQAEAQQVAQYKASLDSFSLDILTNKVASEIDVLDAGFNDDDTATLLRTFRSQQKEASETDLAVKDYFAGGMTGLNPLDSTETGIANKVFNKISEQLDAQPENVKRAATDEFITRTGVIPDKVEADIRVATLSEKPAEIAAAMESAARVEYMAPKAFQTMSGAGELQKDLASFQHMVNDRGFSGEDAARKLLERRSPDFKRNEEILAPAAEKIIKDLSVSDITDHFDGGILASEPGAGADPSTQNALLSDYREAFKEEFIATGGNEAEAKARAAKVLSKTWGVSTVTGDSQMMKYPPEKFYPSVQGGYDYIREDAMATAAELAGVVADKPQGTAVPKAENADLTTLRPLAANEYRDNGDGSWSTEVTTTVQDANGKWMNVPSLWMSPNGWVDLGEDEDAIGQAAQSYEAKGTAFPRFNSVEEAEAAATARSKSGGVANGALAGGTGGAAQAPISKIVLRPDAATAADVRAGRPPRYRLFYTREVDGQTVVDQAPGFWAMPPEQVKAKDQAMRDVAMQEAEAARAAEEDARARAEQFGQQVQEGVGGAAATTGRALSDVFSPEGKSSGDSREQSLDNFLAPPEIPGSKEALKQKLDEQRQELMRNAPR
jgi:hypothetical protein